MDRRVLKKVTIALRRLTGGNVTLVVLSQDEMSWALAGFRSLRASARSSWVTRTPGHHDVRNSRSRTARAGREDHR